MTTSAHPIRLLSRTDSDLTTLFHSFFFVTECDGEIRIISKFPEYKRDALDTIESGIEVYRNIALDKIADVEAFGTYVITITDGSKFYVYWRGFRNRLFLGFSHHYFASFAREVFQLLQFEKPEELPAVVRCLCEIPIFPLSGAQYSIKFRSGSANLSISSTEVCNDEDLNSVALSFLSPSMLVAAWEAIMIERNVLVVGPNPSIVSCCCEFLKRMTLPLNYCNIFIPQILPEQIDVIVDAPLQYIIGADVNLVNQAHLTPHDTVVIDIQSRTICSSLSNSAGRAPDILIKRLIAEVNTVIHNSFASWLSRPGSSTLLQSPFSKEFINAQADSVLHIFIRSNLSLLCSRACSLRAFFRRPSVLLPDDTVLELDTLPVRRKNPGGSTGFERRFGVSYGFMQLLREKSELDDIQHFIPCWVEMDELNLFVFEHADEIPLICLPTNKIESVSPSPIEPEGHVFEIVTKHKQSTYRFTTTDTESRRFWMSFIEEILHQSATSVPNSSGNSAPATPVNGLSNGNSTGVSCSFSDAPGENSSPFCGHQYFISPPYRDSCSLSHIFDMPDDETDQALTHFRGNFMKTQMVSFLSNLIENSEYDSFLRVFSTNISALSNVISDISVKSFLWNGGTISSILERLSNASSVDEFLENGIHVLKTRMSSQVSSKNNLRLDSEKKDRQSSQSSKIDPNAASKAKKSHNILGVFFRNKNETKDTAEVDPDKELEKMKLALEREVEENRLREQIMFLQLVASSYRRCDAELTKKLVEDRMSVISKLLYNHQENQKMAITPPCITIDIHKTIASPSADHTCSVDSSLSESWCDNLWQGLASKYVSQLNSVNDSGDGELDDISDLSTTLLEGADVAERISDIRKSLCSQLSELVLAFESNSFTAYLAPVVHGMLGFLYFNLDNNELGLHHFSKSSNLGGQRRVMSAVVSKFTEMVGAVARPTSRMYDRDVLKFSTPLTESVQPVDVVEFLLWARRINQVVGLQAYRLVCEVIHKNVAAALMADLASSSQSESDGVSLSLGNHRMMPKNQQPNVAHVSELQDGSLRRGGSSVETQDFTWVEPETKSDVLNEAFICTSLSSATKPCELSVELLNRLLELLKTYCGSKSVSILTRCIVVPIVPGLFNELSSTSSLKAFVLQCSKLQKVDLSGLNVNQRLLFFCNIYNVITVHAIISKGSPGNGLLERSSFMRSSKYNIGGMYFSLLDIEHGILRSASTKPMILGPLTVSISFSEKDPRRNLVLDEPKPNISFCLFNASLSSPSLTVLRDPNTVDDELKKCARAYVSRLVRIVDANNKVIELPGIFKIYWSDFGGNRLKVLKFISKLIHGCPIYEELKPLLFSSEQFKNVKIDFAPYDWSPVLIFTPNSN